MMQRYTLDFSRKMRSVTVPTFGFFGDSRIRVKGEDMYLEMTIFISFYTENEYISCYFHHTFSIDNLQFNRLQESCFTHISKLCTSFFCKLYHFWNPSKLNEYQNV